MRLDLARGLDERLACAGRPAPHSSRRAPAPAPTPCRSPRPRPSPGQNFRRLMQSSLNLLRARPSRSSQLRRHAPDAAASTIAPPTKVAEPGFSPKARNTQNGPSTTSSRLISPASADGMSFAPSMKRTKASPIVVRPNRKASRSRQARSADAANRRSRRGREPSAPRQLTAIIERPAGAAATRPCRRRRRVISIDSAWPSRRPEPRPLRP